MIRRCMMCVVPSVTRVRFSALIALCGAFCALMPRVTTAASITLAWDASPDPGIAGYKVYYGPASRAYTNTVLAGLALTVTVSNLLSGGTYFLAATAVDTNGLESDFSAEVSTALVLTNQPPTLNPLNNVSINENAGPQTVSLSGISSGSINESQTLLVTASSSNPGLIPVPVVTYTSPNATGSVAFTPVPFASGAATITVTVNDGGASNNVVSRSFTVTVNPVNQPPTLNTLANVTINENAGQQTVSLSGISSGATNESQTLTVTASSSNSGLIPAPTVTYTSPNASGSIRFTPLALGFGTSTITVTVNDGGASNNIVTRSFTVTVNPVNQTPTLSSLANVTVNQNAGAQSIALSGISSGATNESQTLAVTATSSNPTLVPAPSVTYTSPNPTGSLSFTPNASASGTANITVTVNDGGASNNVVSRSFTVTVNALPTISSITNMVIAMNSSTPAIPFNIGDTETAASSLTVTTSSDNVALVPGSGILLGGSGASRTISVTPASGQTGIANITLTVSDGTGSASRSFALNVRQRPAAPGNFRVVAQTP
jgi:hypothetical protein